MRKVKVSDPSWRHELAAAPPAAFVRTRNAIAARLRKAAQERDAAEVARLRRPSPVVWLVNRLATLAPDGVERLIDATDRLRRAQLRDPRALPEATTRHREALQQLVQRAEEIGASEGLRSSPDVARRLRATVGSAAADRRTQSLLRHGRMTQELAPGGFEVLGAAPTRHLTLVRPSEPRSPAPTPTPAERQRQQAAAREQRRVERREAKAQQQEASQRKAEAARRERRIAQATRKAERLREELRKAEERLSRERGTVR